MRRISDRPVAVGPHSCCGPFLSQLGQTMPRRKRPIVSPAEPAPFVAPGRAAELNTQHDRYLDEIEAGQGLVVAIPSAYPDGYYVPPHRHTRAQLLHPATGVVM